MLGMCQSGLAGAGQTIYGCHIFTAVSQQIFLLAAVAGSIAVAVSNGPCHGQGSLLVLTEVSHTQNAGTVRLGVKVAQSLLLRIRQAVQGYVGTVRAGPLRIRENIDVRFLAVAYRLGILIHLDIFIRHILEV